MAAEQLQGDRHDATVLESEAGTRLDAFLAARFPAFSRNRIKDLILEGTVSVDGAANDVPKYRVKVGESITLAAPEPIEAEPQPQDIALDILFEDEYLIVIDKPAGMVVHPAPGNMDGTLVNALIHHCGDSLRGIGGVKRPGIVHRLDKDTSGVMVAAKTDAAHAGLSAQFADHGRTGPLERAYTAFVWGIPNPLIGTIETLIGREPHNRLKQAVLGYDGREAITHYRVDERFHGEKWSVGQVTCELETGRTHQIRVHMAHIGHPLIGDSLYGSGFMTKINTVSEETRDAILGLRRQALHAAVLGFAHPVSGETLRFESPLPADMKRLANALAKG
ncbi:RluA family pseudouridine synthase [Pelagibacterium luteolum]|uniref:Pseudouridine synthase n=1 Tax=Pelagibacterium luteolum TaxID=440168 RepID=A0A1G7V320_9HYPH|nr:RluA family pseudouridine synthase [Pelagibacterium luteolum]SDG54212.1 23S rRNA pseudouridine1911/1915/1917 synthase [Pelagibacterium luteolum]